VRDLDLHQHVSKHAVEVVLHSAPQFRKGMHRVPIKAATHSALLVQA
jgi:hypothetical protein